MAKRIVVEFAGDTSKLDSAFAKVRTGSSGVEKAVKGIAAGAAFGLVTAQLGDAMKAASDLNESVSKSNNVFGSSAAAIDSWAKTGAQNFGLSRQAALEAASSFGNMFDQLGIGSTQAASMSQSIVELAADFASFHNADISQVIAAQSSAFRGEYDALQRFLPLINAASVEQEALAMTGKKSKDALTEQEKALAVNALMFKGAGEAMGDFDRTADGAANQQRTLAAEVENLKAAIGESLLPTLTDVVGFLINDAIPAFQQLTNTASEPPDTTGFTGFANAVKDEIRDIIGWAASIPTPVLKFAGLFSDSFKQAAADTDHFASQMHKSSQEAYLGAHAADANAAANKVAADILKGSADASGKKTAASQKTTKQLDAETKATVALKDAQLDARQADLNLEASKRNLAKAQDNYNKFLETGGIDMEKVKRAQEDLVTAQKDVEAATLDVAKAQEAVNEALKPATQRERTKTAQDEAAAQDDLTLAQLNFKDAQDELVRITNDRTATEEDKTRALIAANDAARRVADSENALADAHQLSTDLQLKGTTASTAYKDAVAVLNEKQTALTTATNAQKTAQDNLNTAQAVGKDYADKLWDVTNDLAGAQLDLDQKTWGAQKAHDALKTKLGETTGEVRNAWGNVNGYKKSLSEIPKDIKTTVTYEEIYAVPQGTSKANATSYAEYLKSVPSNADPMPYDMWAKRHARAAGGPVTSGVPYLVGELGPELFVPNRSGTIVPNGAGMGTVVNVYFNGVVGDRASAAREIQNLLLEEKRKSGPLGLN